MSTARTNTATLEVRVWFELDRKHIALSRPDGSLVFELRDEEVDEAIEDGFLTSPRHPRPRDEDWREHLVEYARNYGLLN
jgi:hypothetical protein